MTGPQYRGAPTHPVPPTVAWAQPRAALVSWPRSGRPPTSLATLAAMQEAGMDVARLPLAHGSIDEAVQRLRRVRKAAPEVGILVDLPGPKSAPPLSLKVVCSW